MGVKSQRSDQKKRRKTVEKKLEENVKINKYYPFLFKAENG